MVDLTADRQVIHGDNLDVLRSLPDGCLDLVYVDPPFNTGRRQQVLNRIRTVRDEGGTRVGFGGNRYRTEAVSSTHYLDQYDDYLGFLYPRLVEVHRVLKRTGSLYFHIDYRESHYCKVLLDVVFGRQCYLNEVIWSYDYGARTTKRWPAKHDNILVYAKDPAKYYFDMASVDRLPYMAPSLVGPEKAARGKTPTDTWWNTIVPTSGYERTGYPTQKPLAILRRIIKVSSPPDGLVADFFAGSGTTGMACLELGRRFLMVDTEPEAISVMRKRFKAYDGIVYVEGGA